MKKKSDNLRNFDLTVEEIKLEKAIQDLQSSINQIQQTSPNSDRSKFFEAQIEKLEEQLEELRDHTLIR